MQADIAKLSADERRALLEKMLKERDGANSATLYPLSEGERAIWYFHELNRDNASLNLGEALRVKGGLKQEAIAAALAGLVRRHDILRSRLALLKGQPFKRILPSDIIVPEQLALHGLDPAARASKLGRFVDRRFDLAGDPPLRIGLQHEPDGDTILVFAMHHMVADFWSLVVLIGDFFELYAAARADRPAALLPLEASYESFVAEQLRFLASGEAASHSHYWKETLAESPQAPILGARQHDETGEEEGSIVCFELEPSLIASARDYSRRIEVSTYTTLLSAFALLLLRRSGAEALVMGAPVTGRSHERFANVVGYFDNPLPLLIRRAPGATSGDFVRSVQQVVLGAIRHQAYPLQRILEDLRPKRPTNAGPLFNTVFTMLQAPSAAASSLTTFGIGDRSATATLSGFDLQSEPVTRRSAQLDLALTLATPHGRLVGSFEYDKARLSHDQVRGLGEALGNTLEGLVADYRRPVDQVPVLAAAERTWLVETLNATQAPRSTAVALHQPFAEQARAAPDRIALIGGGVEMTYGELDRASNGVARWLEQQAIVPEEHVAVLVPKGWQQVVAVLGILKAGGAYLPVDPALPLLRKQRILERAGARLVLVPRGAEDEVASSGAFRILAVEEAQPSEDVSPLKAGGEARAYTIFTSGSTGEPKGVMISHAGALNTLADVNRRLGVGTGDRVLALSSLSFDLSVYDIFGVLGAGGAIVLPVNGELDSPQSWLELCERHRVTLWNSVPALFNLAVEAAEAEPGARRLAGLRAVMLSGDWIPLDLPARARTACGLHRFISMGGATEASVWSIWYEVEVVDPQWSSIPYGLPMDNQTFYVVDEHLEPVLPGVVGELYIGGAGVMLGYCGDERLTGQALIRAAFSERPLYRTGDLGRRASDGTIEFLGRRDSQVKIRGFRIETLEIEALLKHHEAVRDCVVLAEGRDNGAHLVAFVVVELDFAPDGLRHHLKTLLPDYMVPGRWVKIDEVPLTPNGKVDRQALLAQAAPARIAEEDVRSASTAEEEIVARLFREVLGRTADLNYGFIASGGNSIDAIRLAAAFRRAGYDVATRDVFEAATLAGLAAQLTGRAMPQASALPQPPAYATTLRLQRDIADEEFRQLRADLARHWSADSFPWEEGTGRASRHPWMERRTDRIVSLEASARLCDLQRFRTMAADLIGALSDIAPAFPSGSEEGLPTGEATHLGLAVREPAARLIIPIPERGWWERENGAVELVSRAILSTLPEGAAIRLSARRGPGKGGELAQVLHLASAQAPAELRRGRGELLGVSAAHAFVSAADVHLVTAPAVDRLAHASGIEILEWREPEPPGPAGLRILVEMEAGAAALTLHAGDGAVVEAESMLAPIASAISELLGLAEEPTAFDWTAIGQAGGSVEAGADGEVWRLAPLQHTMLVQCLVDDRPGLYCQHLYWRTVGALDDERLVAAFIRVLEKIPSLRVAFDPWASGEPIQIVQPVRSVEYRRVESDEVRWRQELDELVEADRERGFDLTSAPLLRIYRLRLSEEASILVLCHHHLLFDGWSVGLILDAWLRAYDGEGPASPSIGAYPRFLEHLAERPAAAAAAHWRTLLEGADLPTPLPAGGRAASSFRQKEEEATWDPSFVAKLEGAARAIGATPGALMMAAWGMLLARHCDRDNVVFGVTGAGRPEQLDRVEEIVGLFINTVPVRVTLDAEETLGSVAAKVHRQYSLSRDFEQTPFHEVAQAIEADLRGFDPYRTVIVFENYPDAVERRAPKSGLAFQAPHFTEQGGAPLLAYVFPGESWTVRLVHNAEQFEEGAVAALLAQLRVALECIVEAPSQKLRDTCLASEEDLRFLAGMNETTSDWDGRRTVPALLAERAAARPSTVAVTAAGATLTYEELDTRSSRLARRLVERGVGVGDVVALSCGHSIEMIVGLHAVLKAGAAFLPLDENAPPARWSQAISDSGAVLVLTDGDGRHSPDGVDVIDLRLPVDLVAEVALPACSEGDPAYVIYTSGSSGKPKGVVVSHGALVNYALATRQLYGWGPSDKLLQFFSLGFDGSLEVIVGSVAAGATLALRPVGMEWSVDLLQRCIEDEQITSVSVTTAFWHVWLASLEDQGGALPSTMRSVLIGGEKNSPAAAAGWRRLSAKHPARLFNTYGPTEATIVACVSEIVGDAIDPELGCEFPIGTPVPNASVHVVDRYGHPSPRGATGELYLGGAGLALGYLRDEARTASAFVELETLGVGRLYRTGDKVRLRADGQLEFHGRVDQQLKVRGYRVEPGEIEAALLTIPGIRDCVVLLVGQGSSARLVAHLVIDPAPSSATEEGAAISLSALDPRALKAELRRTLPNYMVPDRFYVLDALPLNRSGKVDRDALPRNIEVQESPAASEAPQGETEVAIGAIWAELLGTQQIGRHDNFFELGGHSLVAVQAVARLSAHFEVQASVADLFATPTVASLAGRMIEIMLAQYSEDDVAAAAADFLPAAP